MTNLTNVAIDNVIITDDVFGAVAGPISLAGSASETFFVTQLIEEPTTNTGTVTGGEVGSTCTDSDEVIVSIRALRPPSG